MYCGVMGTKMQIKVAIVEKGTNKRIYRKAFTAASEDITSTTMVEVETKSN